MRGIFENQKIKNGLKVFFFEKENGESFSLVQLVRFSVQADAKSVSCLCFSYNCLCFSYVCICFLYKCIFCTIASAVCTFAFATSTIASEICTRGV